MTDPNGTPQVTEELKKTTGRTWPDLIAELTTGAPIWVISGAAFGFVGIVAYSAFVMDECRTLAFLGETGACGDRPPPAIGELPENAVVAFASECPEDQGWVRYEEAAARFIIGAATTEELNAGPASFRDGSNEQPLSARPFGKPNGTEMVRLEMKHMPKHTHGVGTLAIQQSGPHRHEILAARDSGGSGGFEIGGNIFWSSEFTKDDGTHSHSLVGESAPAGSNQPHNNMPPYIALYFCKKEG